MKGIIVVDMPDSCSICDLCHESNYDLRYQISGRRFCGIKNENVDQYCNYGNPSKPDWCPIKLLPGKLPEETPVIYTDNDGNVIKRMERDPEICGWNACLDVISED